MIDYRDKIRKLLALAESPNENEARAALLKARELMAEHKLTEAQCLDVPKDNRVERVLTGIHCTPRKNPWIINLSGIIGENYCCQAYSNRKKGQQERHVGYIGFHDDVEICKEIFTYALKCVMSEIRKINEQVWFSPQDRRQMSDSYGYGFCIGVQRAFEEQNRKHNEEWGLVLVMPKEVADETKGMKKDSHVPAASKRIGGADFIRCYEDGKQFDPSKSLKPAADAV